MDVYQWLGKVNFIPVSLFSSLSNFLTFCSSVMSVHPAPENAIRVSTVDGVNVPRKRELRTWVMGTVCHKNIMHQWIKKQNASIIMRGSSRPPQSAGPCRVMHWLYTRIIMHCTKTTRHGLLALALQKIVGQVTWFILCILRILRVSSSELCWRSTMSMYYVV